MVETKVVSGKVIEQRGNVVITVQGGLVSSYDLRYYSLPMEPEFMGIEGEGSMSHPDSSSVVLSPDPRHAFFGSRLRGGKKSAHHA
ncbi:hypothetical protein B9G55_11015 [Saccharibacillus sp. O16]|nr:hypothetical protein B9G55_11015 [Saccharibacillus sp. O16]